MRSVSPKIYRSFWGTDAQQGLGSSFNEMPMSRRQKKQDNNEKKDENQNLKDFLQILLIRELRANGYKKICRQHKSDYENAGATMSKNFLIAILLSLIIFAVQDLKFTLLTSLGLVFASLILLVILVTCGMPAAMGYSAYFLGWITSGAIRWESGGWSELSWSHLFPLLFTIGSHWAIKALRLATRVPFFIPLALVIVILPLLTEDPWRLAVEAKSRLAWLATLSVLLPAGLIASQLLRIKTASVMNSTAKRIENSPDIEDHVLQRLKKRRTNQEKEIEIDEARAKNILRSAYSPAHIEKRTKQAEEAARRAFPWLTLRKFISLLLGIAISTWTLIYTLAWTAVPISLGVEWSKWAGPVKTLEILEVNTALPLGPYPLVATLMATVACVAFLSFALTEDQYSDALREALTQGPLEKYMHAALPYMMLSGNKKASSGDSRSKEQKGRTHSESASS